MARVADVLDRWAADFGFSERRTIAWRAAGHLHDALRDAPPPELAMRFPRTASLPGRARHGPAAAILLRREGLDDAELLRAVRWHTLGSRKFGLLGKALYAADFLEPGRPARSRWRAELRARVPAEIDLVLAEIAASRIDYLLRAGRPLQPRTIRFWNSLVAG